MTRPITTEELAARAGYHEQSMRRARDVLVAIKVLRIVDGGPGRPTTYELLPLPGAGVADPALPLIGRVRRLRASIGPTLFDSPVVAGVDATPSSEQPSKTSVHFARKSWGWLVRLPVLLHGSLPGRLWTSVHFARKCVETSVQKYRKSRPVVGVASRARESTYTQEEYVHTHTAPVAAEPPPSPRPPHPWHAWCDGRVHVPRKLHEEFVAKLRLPDAELFAIYRAENAALVPTAPILDKDEYAFWRQRFAQRFARDNRAPPSPATPAPWCQEHDPPCTRWTEHRDRVLTDARAERARDRKSG